jgi:phage recombination protein Bet
MNKIEKVNVTQGVDVDKIKKYLQTMNLASNLTNAEVEQFIEIAQSFELNPFKREIYANKYGDKFSVIVGFETYIKRAERSGLLSGWSVTTEGTIDRQNIMNSDLRAIITIHRKDFEFPFVHDVYFIEYVGRKRDGSVTEFWRNKPFTMIKKVAMAQGFRLCFSDELGGMPYTNEELSTMESDAVVVETIKPEKKKRESKPEPVQAVVETITKDTVRIRTLLDSIRSSNSLEQLVEIWKSNEDLHAEVVFKNAMTERKKYIQTINQSEPAKVVNPIFELIKNAQTPEEIFDLTIDENDSELLQFANERIQQLYSETPIDEVK